MKLFLALVFSFGFAGQSFASQDPGFQKLIDLSIKNGKPLDTAGGTYMVLETETVDPTHASTQKDYFSSVGGYDKNVFQVDHSEVVSELWTTNSDTNIVIDQWVFVVDNEAQLISGQHSIVIETSSRQIVSEQDFHPDKYEQTKQWYFELGALKTKFLP